MSAIGKTYPMQDVTVTVKSFTNPNGEEVVYFDVVGVLAGCRKHLKANAETDFFLDFLGMYGKPVDVKNKPLGV